MSLEDRLQKFKDLKLKRRQADSENRKDLYKEHQRNRTNPQQIRNFAKKQNEAELNLHKLDGGDQLDEVERKKLWNYSVEDNEAWETKTARSKFNKNAAKILDYDNLAERTYLKGVEEIAKKRKNEGFERIIKDEDHHADYNFDHKPSSKDLALLVNSLKSAENHKIAKTNKTKEKNNKGSAAYINRKNKEFNEKLSRHYDKYTKDIRDNLEKIP